MDQLSQQAAQDLQKVNTVLPGLDAQFRADLQWVGVQRLQGADQVCRRRLFAFAGCVCPQTGQVHSLLLPPPPKFVSTFATLRI